MMGSCFRAVPLLHPADLCLCKDFKNPVVDLMVGKFILQTLRILDQITNQAGEEELRKYQGHLRYL